eukprot:1844936-Rhodomonas_salina.4
MADASERRSTSGQDIWSKTRTIGGGDLGDWYRVNAIVEVGPGSSTVSSAPACRRAYGEC